MNARFECRACGTRFGERRADSHCCGKPVAPLPRYTHRIRRCDGNRDAWLLVALDDDGNESQAFGSYKTAMSIDDLLRHSGGLLPMPGDVVEIVYYAPDAP